MIRGVDAQVMTQRAAEYSKDVSAMLRRDEVANEFASRMNRLNVQQEMQAVSQLEKAEQQRVRRDAEQKKEGGSGGKRGEDGKDAAPRSSEPELPSIGRAESRPLLDIEI